MVCIAAVAAINSLGDSLLTIKESLLRHQGSEHNLVKKTGLLLNGKGSWFGCVEDDLNSIKGSLNRFNTRNNQLLYAAYLQIQTQIEMTINKYGPKRVAIIMGTSTSGIHEGDEAIKYYLERKKLPNEYSYNQQELGDPSSFLVNLLHIQGPAYTISTACTSSARAIISGKRLIDVGVVDAVIVGGADSLSRMPINGFDALDSISSDPCRPFAKDRNGINIGEGAALFLLTKDESSDMFLYGFGESSDAYHISAPHPEGIGAEKAMKMALKQSQLTMRDIGYINLHGTATKLNDQAESKAVFRAFLDDKVNGVPCSSTKHLTGHTLGVAAATELAISYLLIKENLLLPKQNFTHSPLDPDLPDISIIQEDIKMVKPIVMSNSFAFGGNNTSLIIGKK